MHAAATKPGSSALVASLIAERRPGHALGRAFYNDAEVYERDLERIFLRNWLYVGHVSEIAEPGDYLTYEIAGESVIVVRGTDGAVRALINVCRHRGSRICDAPCGNTRWLVCPYHGWTYDLDGSLRTARLMPKDFDKSTYGLRSIHAAVFHGLIFINFADDAGSLDAAHGALDEHLAPYRLENTKVIARETYTIDANWKLMLENYMECYHCAPSHPEFSDSHSIKLPESRSAKLHAAMAVRACEIGATPDSVDFTWNADDPSRLQYYYGRYALFEGYQTGTEDGAPAAPPLGDLTGHDGGASDLQLGPISHFLIYADHAVTYRFTPRALHETECEVAWLIRDDAVEGTDYDVARVTWLWRVTTEADKAIVERNQQGVNSRYYVPGPYAPMENYCAWFVDWYLAAIA